MLAGITMYRDNAVNLEKQACAKTLELINGDPKLHGLPIVVVIEAAPGISASYISAHISEYAQEFGITKLFFIREVGARGDIGVLKTKNSTDFYRFALEFALRHKILAYSNNLKTIHPNNTPEAELNRLCEMIRGYHYDAKTLEITSKVSGSADDILASLNQLLYWIGVFWKSPKYALYREEILSRTSHSYPYPLTGAPDRLQRK
jgi:hypothetical protein